MAYKLQDVLNMEESLLRLYFDDIADSTPLSREREVGLSAKIHAGDMAARDELVQANLRFVIDVAKNYQGRGLSLIDLISAGNVGLMTAAERFDGTRASSSSPTPCGGSSSRSCRPSPTTPARCVCP